ncbi:hypothetical protein [Streptomyces spinosirectus]
MYRFFCEALKWEGEPVNKEPQKCLALTWFTVHDLPDDIIEYPDANLLGHLGGAPLRCTTGSSAASLCPMGAKRVPITKPRFTDTTCL